LSFWQDVPARKQYPSDVSDEEWVLVAPYLTLLSEDADQRERSLQEAFNDPRYTVKADAPWRWMPNDRHCHVWRAPI
jgi:transposase